MSSNLLKVGFTRVNPDEVRIIDVNAMMEKRRNSQERQTQAKQKTEGFVSGILAQQVTVEPGDPEESGEDGLSGNVIKAMTETPQQLMENAQQEAQAILESARQEAQDLLDEAMRKVEEEKERTLEMARKQGYEEGKRKFREEEGVLRKQLEDKEKQLEKQYQKNIDELEPRFIEVLTGIYEQIFHVNLESYRDILVYLITHTIRSVENSREYIIRVSKEDYPFVSMQKKQLSGISSTNVVEIVQDITMKKNECLIETESGIFDCGVDTQLEELSRTLKLLSYKK